MLQNAPVKTQLSKQMYCKYFFAFVFINVKREITQKCMVWQKIAYVKSFFAIILLKCQKCKIVIAELDSLLLIHDKS